MGFQLGHTLSRGPRKPGGGRKQGLKRQFKEALELDKERNLGKYIERMANQALGGEFKCPHCGGVCESQVGNEKALEYMIDRHLGKPHSSLDARVSANIELTGDDYALIALTHRQEIEQISAPLALPEAKSA